MIQRIQHLLLLLALLLNVGFFFTPLFLQLIEDPSSWLASGMLSGLSISGLLALSSIFMYGNRPKQILYVKRAVLFQLLGIAVSTGLFFSDYFAESWMQLLPLVLPLLALVLMIVAVTYIRKDEELIKSMDRIR